MQISRWLNARQQAASRHASNAWLEVQGLFLILAKMKTQSLSFHRTVMGLVTLAALCSSCDDKDEKRTPLELLNSST